MVVLYVDDLLITGPTEQEIADFKAELSKTFDPYRSWSSPLLPRNPIHYR